MKTKKGMRHQTIRFLSFGVLLFNMLTTIGGYPVYAEDIDDNTKYELPEEIRINKQDFDTIPNVIAKYEGINPNRVAYIERVNGEKRIQRINFIDYEDDHVQINGEMTFDIPEEVAKVARFFKDFRFEGEVASDMKLSLINPNGESFTWQILPGHVWHDGITGLPTTYTKTGWISSQNTGLMEPWQIKDSDGHIIYDGYKLVIHGTGKLKDIYIWEEDGVMPTYDITGYTIMGADKPWIDDVKITVDATKNLSVNGVNKLDERKFKRYHVNSGPIGLESNDTSYNILDQAYHSITTQYGFLPGRGAFHFNLLERYMGMVEDAEKPGYADYSVFNERFAPNRDLAHKYDTLYPTIGNDYVVTTDGWPTWQAVNPKDIHVAAPRLDRFEGAAELTGKLVAGFHTKFYNRGPKYLEVKNESTISVEWPYLNTHPDKAWDYLADFHNQVAAAIKKESPETLVGGPSSAFMYLEKDDFDEAKKQLAFMDATKESLDYYSHHFYENGPMLIHERDNNPDGFLAGRLEAVVELLNNHMVLTDNVKPILITEEGTYNNAGTPIDYFKKLRTYNGYMLRFINMSDTIDMITPYVYPIINWRPNSNGTFYRYNDSQTGLAGTTPLMYYLDIWKDYRGAFLPVESDNHQVYTHAVQHGRKIYVAVQNLNAARAYINLNIETGKANIVDVKRKRTFLELGELTHEEITVKDIKRVPMRVEEMTIFEITLDKEPKFSNTLHRDTYYGDKTLVKTGLKPADFTITCDVKNLEGSMLRIGFGKTGYGFTKDMTVHVNGTEYRKDLSFTHKEGDFFGYVDIKLNKQIIKNINDITVSIPEEGGYISNITLYNDYLGRKPKRYNTNRLKHCIKKAKADMNSVAISTDNGNDLEEGILWVTQEVKDTYQYVIESAEIALDDPVATRHDVDQIMDDLLLAGQMFRLNTKEALNK